MARIEKYGRGSTGHLFEHYNRDQVGEHCEIKRPDLTVTNYNLAPDGEQTERLRAVIGNKEEKLKGFAKCLNRKDVKVLCSCCVTVPKDLSPDKEAEFFRASYDFLKAKFGVGGGDGDKNIISAFVHRDETTPHMHFAFVPLADDGKGGYKVSAKEVITRDMLRSLHKDMQEYLEKRLGCVVNIRNGQTKANKTVQELKVDTEARKELANVEALKTLEALSELERKCQVREAEKPNIILRLAGAEEHGVRAEIPYNEYLRLRKTLLEGIEAIKENARLNDQGELIQMLNERTNRAETRCKEQEKIIDDIPQRMARSVAAALEDFKTENAKVMELGKRLLSLINDGQYGVQVIGYIQRTEKAIKDREFNKQMEAKGLIPFERPKNKTTARTQNHRSRTKDENTLGS